MTNYNTDLIIFKEVKRKKATNSIFAIRELLQQFQEAFTLFLALGFREGAT